MEQKDYYDILGVQKNASAQQIKEAFRNLAFTFHPDRNAESTEAVEKMKAVNEAYAVLSNPQKRREYDALQEQFGASAHRRFRNNYTDQDIFRGSDINQVFEEMAKAFGVRGFDDIFKQFYGPGYRTFEYHRPGVHFKGFVFSGWFGGHRPLLPGVGNISKLSRLLLGKLGVARPPEKGKDIYDVIRLNPQYALAGGPYAYYHRKRRKKLVVRIPPRTKDGQKIRLSGMGEEGKAGGTPGDLYLKVTVKKPLLQNLKNLIGLSRKG